jgi:hypothetical protein
LTFDVEVDVAVVFDNGHVKVNDHVEVHVTST